MQQQQELHGNVTCNVTCKVLPQRFFSVTNSLHKCIITEHDVRFGTV
jgi:hypothetical protein